MLPMLGLYADVYKERDGKHGNAYALIEPLKHRLFPETFEYVHKGLDGVETTTTQVLFGDLIAAVEEKRDRDVVRLTVRPRCDPRKEKVVEVTLTTRDRLKQPR